MGKSAAGTMLKDLGVDFLDTDLIARQVSEVGQPAYGQIVSRFGARCIAEPGGPIDRRQLAAIVFQDAAARADLEAILHPRIHAQWKFWLASRRASGAAFSAVLIPLLFEKGYENQFEVTATVACTAPTQARRLAARGWECSHAAARIQAQMPAEEKMRRARFVVWTEGSLATHQAQWVSILASLKATCCPA